MPTSDQNARAIAFLAAQCRPIDARAWQDKGIVKRIAGDPRDLHEVILDTIATALDASAETPGAIGKIPWRIRLLALPTRTPRNPRPDECCKECGRGIDICAATPCEKPTLRPTPKSAPTPEYQQARAQLRPTTGDTDG